MSLALPVVARPLVSLSDLRVELGGKPILRGVTANIARGSITALIGLNGSGKTTLLRALVNEYPHKGTIKFHCGHDHSQPYPEAIGYVPQRLTLDARLPLTVSDFLALTLSRRPLFFGISKKVAAKSREMLERVEVANCLDVPVEGLSGGQLQRVLLALALEPQPELLLLDEPAAGIDFKDQKKFYELIATINREMGVTVLLVSHDLNMVQTYAHEVLCLRSGAIQCQGSPNEILTPINMSLVFGAEIHMFPHRFGT
ncbi:metal ABC transporter ATP-binding protein [Gemmata sp. G18]|uniref:Metal ABC transporter ATP-binding protein n=1 Tax=Gemmata palustris TaxID=2822762 RepID=A0ABS5BMX2_9BACT|nr:metal ABC transporter ATP-binding protein [Gemmata palustris]MBP3954650.1 metal ABC transporter ATP-binding protein [Gemmata palustris]